MSNILYLGPYREFTSMGNASRLYIKALLMSGHNISIRPIYNTFKAYPIFDIDNDIIELENNFHKKYHTVIQHCYPHQYYYDSRFDNIVGILNLEATNYKYRLKDYIEIPDRLIAPSDFVKNVALESQTKKNIDVIPYPIDLDNIKQYKNNNPQKTNNKSYIFYIIADFIHKNNIDKILKAFWLAFDNYDNIELIIKTKNRSQEYSDLHRVIEYEFAKIDKIVSKKNKQPRVIIGETKKEAILYLHNNNHCYIDIASGKNFGYSILESLCFENACISMNHTAQSEITKETDNFIIDSYVSRCEDDSKIYEIYNTVDQKWFLPDIDDLIKGFRSVVMENNEQKSIRLQKTKEKIKKYDIHNISEQIKKYDF